MIAFKKLTIGSKENKYSQSPGNKPVSFRLRFLLYLIQKTFSGCHLHEAIFYENIYINETQSLILRTKNLVTRTGDYILRGIIKTNFLCVVSPPTPHP